ncbi:MAG: nitroreductase family protein [Clostridiales bacterium]|nr:nitroreductase family protein [Clostridiales bacterium]MDO4350687.1 nitroreductase family protein [Eubacteriales bacterium]MDY4008018.1 nitroreductase family protein [Candidatus Limiplasma sp.]
MSLEAIRARRSIRRFRPDAVPRELIDQVLEAARLAPSGKNQQPWRFAVYGGEAKRALLEAMARGLERELRGQALLPGSRAGLADAANTLRIMRKAPVTILALDACGDDPFAKSEGGLRVADLVNTLSMGAAIENLLLAAQELGLGALWIANTFFAYPELCACLDGPFRLASAVALGYAGEAPQARPRKPLAEIVSYHL